MQANLESRGVGVEVEVSVQDIFAELYHESVISAETWQEWCEKWLEILKTELPPADGYELSLRLTDDAEIQELNAQYRNKNQPTDVLAFAALEAEIPQSEEMMLDVPLYLGDLVISVETASRQAQERDHSLQTELAWLAAHGLLHLLGWDHPDEDSLTEMLSMQATLLGAIGDRSLLDQITPV
ncbi:MAG TPA: rRNA maturation RNase YbeY [Cyanobacteria bacterium UBA11369]|nr:rRNA maturation RNase YbeY [Cyanobacteria bacterium UBA11371]HBE36314.1 rRNA maturation RNase YbeY [Cyanobacteria bacterium UBA11368]HBE51430.1 rRNA maturation RNase YbeY [Cyanobacteria bacterium UBA11369]